MHHIPSSRLSRSLLAFATSPLNRFTSSHFVLLLRNPYCLLKRELRESSVPSLRFLGITGTSLFQGLLAGYENGRHPPLFETLSVPRHFPQCFSTLLKRDSPFQNILPCCLGLRTPCFPPWADCELVFFNQSLGTTTFPFSRL